MNSWGWFPLVPLLCVIWGLRGALSWGFWPVSSPSHWLLCVCCPGKEWEGSPRATAGVLGHQLPPQALGLSKHGVPDRALRLPRALALHRFRALTALLFPNSAVSFTSRNQMKAALSPTASPAVVILTPFPPSPLRLSKAEPLILDLGR